MKISDWISLASLSLALAAFIYSWITSIKVNKQQELINDFELKKITEEESEKKKASIECNIIKNPNPKKYSNIKVYNKGRASASNIKLIIKGDTQENPLIYMRIPDDFFPYPQLSPQQSFEIPYVNGYLNQGYHIEFKFEWDDDFSANREYTQYVDLS